jgi:hypothetical protein
MLRRFEILHKIRRKRDSFSLDNNEIFKGTNYLDNEEKIIFSTKKLIFEYTNKNYIDNQSTFIIKSREISLKYLFTILNSKVVSYYLKNNDTKIVNKKVLSSIPLKRSEDVEIFEIILDYIIFLKSLEISINEFVSNRHMIYSFEQVINAMVFELYFKREFIELKNRPYSKELKFIEYAKEDYQSIHGLNWTKQKGIINQSFKILKKPDNQIRNNLILMGIELKDLIVQINRNA